MDFGEFLGQMNSQTGNKLSLPNRDEIVQRHLAPPAPMPPAKTAVSPPPPPSPAPIAEEHESREDTVSRIYEATSAVLKTLKQAFPNPADRRMAFESIQNAIDLALNEGTTTPIARQPSYRPTAPQAPKAASPRPPRGQMVEDGQYIVPRQNMELEGMTVDTGYTAVQMTEATGDPSYSRAIDIRPGQGLTGVSEQDIADLKALAGI